MGRWPILLFTGDILDRTSTPPWVPEPFIIYHHCGFVHMNDQPIAFISCGQVTEDEKLLGKAVVQLVADLTPFQPYFAEEVHSLEGLTSSILGGLDRAIALIAIMHPRGVVTGLRGETHTRGSVWIEQEIAIAAHLRNAHAKPLHVALYVHADIKREGLRDQLHLNPVRFRTNEQVLTDLKEKLPTWSLQDTAELKPKMAFSFSRLSGGVAEFELAMLVRNLGSSTIDDYHIDLRVPARLLEGNNTMYTHELTHKRTNTHRFFRYPAPKGRVGPVYPDDENRAFTVPLFLDRERAEDQELRTARFHATLFVHGKRASVSQTVAAFLDIPEIAQHIGVVRHMRQIQQY